MKIHLQDSEERRHYVVKRYDTVDTKIQTLYTGKFTATFKKNVSPHSHAFLEIMFVVSGSGYVKIENKVHPVNMGDIIIYYQGQAHCEWSEQGNPLGALFFAVKPTDQLKLMFSTAKLPNVVSMQKDYRDYFHLFSILIIEAQNDDQSYFDKVVNCLSKTIILKILQQAKNNEPNETNETVKYIKEYIDEHYLEDFSLIDLYKKFYVSEFYGSRLFKQYVGTTPVSYIISKRMERARELLKNSDDSITSIGSQLGYKDIYYFTKIFKKEVGVSPTAYRKTFGN